MRGHGGITGLGRASNGGGVGAKRGTAGGAGAEMWRGAGPLRAELRGSGLDLKGSGAAVWGRSVRGGRGLSGTVKE